MQENFAVADPLVDDGRGSLIGTRGVSVHRNATTNIPEALVTGIGREA